MDSLVGQSALPMSSFLTQFGLNLASASPRGGLIATAAEAAKEPLKTFQAMKVQERSDDKDLLERASYITFDQFVMNTIQQIQDIEVNLSSVQADYGKNHPEVKRLRSQIVTLEETLKKRLDKFSL